MLAKQMNNLGLHVVFLRICETHRPSKDFILPRTFFLHFSLWTDGDRGQVSILLRIAVVRFVIEKMRYL